MKFLNLAVIVFLTSVKAHALVAPFYQSQTKLECALTLPETSQHLHVQAIKKIEFAPNNVILIESTTCEVKVALDFDSISDTCISAKVVAKKCSN